MQSRGIQQTMLGNPLNVATTDVSFCFAHVLVKHKAFQDGEVIKEALGKVACVLSTVYTEYLV
jgi:hypothetical protein